MEIRKVTTQEELYQVGRFRYDILVKEMGYPSTGADHVNKTVLEPLDDCGHVFAAWSQGKVVGTIRVNLVRDCFEKHVRFITNELPDSINKWSLSITNKFAVARNFRKTSLMIKLGMKAFQFGLENGITHDVIYCYSNMTQMYNHLGYEFHRRNISNSILKNISIMTLSLHDEEHLGSIRSPLYRTLKSYSNSQLVPV